MDYLNYAAEFQPIMVSDKPVMDLELLEIPIPTYNLDSKMGLPSKKAVLPVLYRTYWKSNNKAAPLSSVKSLYRLFISSWEGKKLSKVSGDKGGLTNNGITLNTWKAFGSDKNKDGVIDAKDLALMTEQDHANILDEKFWKVAKADDINNPYLAAYVVDWMWGTGPKAFKKMHEAFGLKPQSKMTLPLIDKLNANPGRAFNILHNARRLFYINIAKNDPSLEKFLKGWLKRADAITLNGMTLNK